MDALRKACASGDDAVAEAATAAGKKKFVRLASRAFARVAAGRGDLETAREIARLAMEGRRRRWFGARETALARRLFGAEDALEMSFDGEDDVLVSREIVSGSGAREGLIDMVSRGLLAEAVVHARIIGDTDPEEVFSAMASVCGAKAREYVGLLSVISARAGPDSYCRRLLLDSAVAHAGGWLSVKRPAREDDTDARLEALYTVTRSREQKKKGKNSGKTGASAEYKTLSVGDDCASAERVEVIRL